jgi:enoyl-CoA hydratase
MSPELGFTQEGDVVRIRLQRADKGNALSASLVTELTQAIDRAAMHNARLFVLEGEGRHFCTGFDLSNLEHETDDSLLSRFTRVELMLQALHAAPFTTLALAHGRTMGAGADIFGACAERWVVGEASFAFPGAAFGLVLGSARLADAVGSVQAGEWIQSGVLFSSEEALSTGWAQRCVTAAAVPAEIERLAARCTRLDGPTQTAIHLALDGSRRPRGDAGDALDLSRLVQSAARPGLRDRIAAYRAAQKKT